MFNFIDIYSFIPVSGCVGMITSAVLCSGPIMLLIRSWSLFILLRRLSNHCLVLTIFLAKTPYDCNFESPTEKVECNFESGTCGWIQDRTDDFDWTRTYGETGSSDTGPTNGHTFESGKITLLIDK